MVLQRNRTILMRLFRQQLINVRRILPSCPNALQRVRRIQRRIHDLHAIQPMLDMVAAQTMRE